MIKTECFDFKKPGYKPGKKFQECSLCMIFDIKPYSKFKARLVTGDHHIDPGQLSIRATVVKSVSVRLLDIIVHYHNLKTLCGDIGNVFINIFTKEKNFCRAGPEFGQYERVIVVIRKVLYGLTIFVEQWRSHFSDYIRLLDFVLSHYNRDI